jgi:hypothetical protein
MARFKVIESKPNEVLTHACRDNLILHEDILDILFKHKGEVHRKLIDLRGIFLIDHIAIKIIDPSNRIVVFSITPSVEYNLIVQGLWKYDLSFSTHFQKDNSFYAWEKAYLKPYFNEIKYIKEQKHGFTFGFNISKRINAFNFIYSYATRSKNTRLPEYYYNYTQELSALGDYGYKLIHGIYAKYCNPDFELPSFACKKNYPAKPMLKLLINKNK